MKKYPLISLFLLSSCMAPLYGNQLTWRPRNFDGPPYVITTRIDHDVLVGAKNVINLFIDGDLVIQNELSPLDNSGSFVSNYKNHNINLNCPSNRNGISCNLFIDAEFVGEIQ